MDNTIRNEFDVAEAEAYGTLRSLARYIPEQVGALKCGQREIAQKLDLILSKLDALNSRIDALEAEESETEFFLS